MIKQKNINLALFIIAILTVGALSASTIATISAASQSSSNIQVSFTVTSPDFALNNIYINEENKQTAVTYSATNTIEFDAVGQGTITLTDATGHEYYRVVKTTVGQAHYLVRFELDTVGLYDLTIRMSASDSEYVDAKIALDYKSIPLPPNTGAQLSEQTGYTYFGGYAINNLDAILLAIVLTVVAVIVFILVRQHQDEKAPTVTVPHSPKARVISSRKNKAVKSKKQTGRKARASSRPRKS